MKKQQISFRPAAPDELQIDLDRPRARIPKRLLRLVAEHVKIRKVTYSRSKSGNTHVTIRIAVPHANGRLPEASGNVGSTPTDGNKGVDSSSAEQQIGNLPLVSTLEKLFLQAALGSDPVRELLSWGRARNGCPYPTLFFEKEK